MHQDLEQLKQRLPLLDYLLRSNWTARPAGTPAEFVGLCPLHRETQPSFYVNARKHLFYCHGCGRGGDLIRLVELSRGLSFRQSIAYLQQQIPVPDRGSVLEKTAAFYQLQPTGIPKRSTISNNAGCATPPSSKNWVSAMLPAATCGAISPPKAMRSICCSTPASSTTRAATPSAGV